MKDRPRPEPERHANAPRPRFGNRFNPHHEICGFYPPDIVGRQKRESGLSDSHKRLYERSVRWAGRNGRFWYGFETIGKELGKSSRQVKRDMDDLEKLGLIQHDRRGKRQSNMYYFLFHPMFESEVTSVSSHPRDEVTDLSSEVTSTSLGEVTPVSLELCKENYIRESSSERVESRAITNAIVDGRSDDEPPFDEVENPTPEALVDLVNSRSWCEGTDPLMDAGPLPRKFLEAAALSIHASKCNTGYGGVDLTLYPAPDITITIKIVEPWRGKGILAFVDWICSTVERQLGRKGRAGGVMVYGLFLTDSQECARVSVPGVLMSKRASLQVSIQKEQAVQRLDQERHQQLMDTPVLLADAIRTLDSEVREWKAALRPRFLWLMERRVNAVSPSDLLAASIAFRKCQRCGDNGIIGSPLKRTLNFCECEIGGYERLARGEGYISEEIARIGATLKSRLVQACRELKHEYTGDAIAQNDTTVTEQSDSITILPGKGAENWCDQGDMRRALEYLGDLRPVQVDPSQIPLHRPPPPVKPITQDDVARFAVEYRNSAPARREPASADSIGSPSEVASSSCRRQS